MKHVACYNCESARNDFYAEENGFTLVKCAECGLLYVNPRPEDEQTLRAHHEGKHHGSIPFDITGAFDAGKIREYSGVLTDFFGDELKDGFTWLDVGCGHGEFMLAVQRHSQGRVVVEGADPNPYKRASAQKRGLHVYDSSDAAHAGRYDMLSLLNVYSHLPDPPAVFAGYRRLLKPGGELFIQTGDTADMSSEDHYRPLYLPDHLSFGSEAIIRQVLQRSGFEIVSVRKYPLVTADPLTVVREAGKAIRAMVMPRYRYSTKWQYLRRHKLYGATDMFIRARLKPERVHA
jgi:SAM-dependent methyltransferase